jgi:hypothetical protein
MSDDDLVEDWAAIGHPHVEPEPEPLKPSSSPQTASASPWTRYGPTRWHLSISADSLNFVPPVSATASFDGQDIILISEYLEGLPPGNYTVCRVYREGEFWRDLAIHPLPIGVGDSARLTVRLTF